MEIKETTDSSVKSNICNNILRKLPKWFGNEDAIVDYVKQVCNLPFFTAFENEKPIGFIAIKIHNPYTAEVYVMGVLEEKYRKGIGTALINASEKYCRIHGLEYLTVKTLDGSAVYEPYEGTRTFYRQIGFIPLEVFKTYWDEENPCLFMVKHIEYTGKLKG